MLTVCAATLLALMNYTAPMVVMPTLTADLGGGTTGATWILNGISLGMAATLLTTGTLADSFGRRRVFLLGSLLLAGSSVLVALAPETVTFVIGRLAQGAGSAAMTASGLGLVAAAFSHPPARAKATAVWGSMLGAGIATGPIASAGLAGVFGWRSFYLAVAAATVVLVLVGWFTLAETALVRRRIDVLGAVTMTGAVTALLTALTIGRTGWLRADVLALTAVAVVLFAAFGWAEVRTSEPMIDPRLFREPTFVASTIGALLTGIAVIGLMSYLPTVLQHDMNLSPLASGWLFALWSGLAFVVALLTRLLPSGFDARRQLVTGLVFAAAGHLALLGAATSGHWGRTVAGLAIGGIGSGLLNAALARLALESVPPHRSAMGAGANNTARYVGASVGVAITIALMTSGTSAVGVDIGLVTMAALALLGAIGMAALRRTSTPRT